MAAVPATPSCAVRRYCAHRAVFGIVLRLPSFAVRAIFSAGLKGTSASREDYAIGTGQWRALPFGMNALTHSRQRYQRNLRFYADEPQRALAAPLGIGYAKAFLAGGAGTGWGAMTMTPHATGFIGGRRAGSG